MNNYKRLGWLAVFFASLAHHSFAGTWTGSAAVAPSVMYTDNVCLTSKDEKSEWIGLVTPAGSLRGVGKSANLSITASVEINSLSDSRLEKLGCGNQALGNRKQYSPRVSGRGDAILVEDWLFIDGSVRAYQNEISAFATGGGDSLDRAGNTNTTYSYQLSPYLQRRFRDVAQAYLRYTWDDQYNTADIVRDSSEQQVQASLGDVPGTSRFFWEVAGRWSEVDYSDTANALANQTSELSSAQLNLNYQFNRAWQVNGYVGQENNDFFSLADEIDGDFWDVGVRWTPNARTEVNVGTGDRFFGTTPRFSISHRHKRSTFSASYLEDLTYQRNIRALNDDDIPEFNPGLSTVTTSPILDKRFSLAYNFRARRTGFTISAYRSDQTREDNLRESRFTGVSSSFSRSISRATTLSARLQWQQEDPRREEPVQLREIETWRASLSLRRQLSSAISVSANYQYTDRQSDLFLDESAFRGYTENRLTLTMRFEL